MYLLRSSVSVLRTVPLLSGVSACLMQEIFLSVHLHCILNSNPDHNINPNLKYNHNPESNHNPGNRQIFYTI